MQSSPAFPCLSNVPCFASSEARLSKHPPLHKLITFTCPGQIISNDHNNHSPPKYCFDGCVHASLTCLESPVSNNTPSSFGHSFSSLSSSYSSAGRALKTTVFTYPFPSSSSSSSSSPLSSSFSAVQSFDGCVHPSLRCLESPVSNTPSYSSAGRAFKSIVFNNPFPSPSSSSSPLSSSFSAVQSLKKSTVFSSPFTFPPFPCSLSRSVAWKGTHSNNPLSSPSYCCGHVKHRCNHITTHATTVGISSKHPVSNSPFPTSSSCSHKQNVSSVVRQKGKCNCNLLSQAADFLSEKLGLSDEDTEGEKELSQGSPQSAIKIPKEREGSQTSMVALAQRWREIQGLNHWKGLLDPLDLELRRTLLFYGDFNQAVYDSFETDVHSKYTGACRFAKEDFFRGVALVKGREVQYNVVRYLYATSSSIDIHGLVFMKSYSREAWSKESNWIGYVAVSNDEATKVLGRRDIVIVWRGTMRPFEWLDDFDFRKTDITTLLPASSSQQKKGDDGGDEPSIEQGWLTIYTNSDSKSAFTSCSARDQVLNEVRLQLKKHKDEDVSITIMGHSLGAALAVVNAFDIAANKINLREGKEAILVTAFVYGCPGVGDEAFAKKCEEIEGLRVLRVKNKIDLITRYPGWLMGYRDVGEELIFDSKDSPYLKKSKTPGDWHNLEVHLHMVAGTQGVGKPFKFTVNRDVALVNKSSEALSDDFLVPGSWWQLQYKGLVQQEDGFWYMPDREEGKRPEPEPLNDLSLPFGG